MCSLKDDIVESVEVPLCAGPTLSHTASSAEPIIQESNTLSEDRSGSLSSELNSTEQSSDTKSRSSHQISPSSTDTPLSPPVLPNPTQRTGNNRTGKPERFGVRKGSSEWKMAIVKYLSEHPGNLSACAKHFEITREEVERVLQKNPKDSENLKNGLLDRIEEMVYLAALGEYVPKHFNMGNALRILKEKRPKEWGGKEKKEDEDMHGPPVLTDEQVEQKWVNNEFGTFLERRPIAEQPNPTIIRVDDPSRSFIPANDSERFERVHSATPVGGPYIFNPDDSDL